MTLIRMKATLGLLLAFALPALSDDEASNRPHVAAAEWGGCYAKSVPSSTYGNDGETKIYLVQKHEDILVAKYAWFSNPIHLHCGLGRGTAFGLSVVKFGPFPRGKFPDKKTLAIAFYLSDSLLKSHSTLDIAGSKENRSTSISHYTVIEEVLGYRWIKENDYVFEIRTADKKVVTFDPVTGEILSRK